MGETTRSTSTPFPRSSSARPPPWPTSEIREIRRLPDSLPLCLCAREGLRGLSPQLYCQLSVSTLGMLKTCLKAVRPVATISFLGGSCCSPAAALVVVASGRSRRPVWELRSVKRAFRRALRRRLALGVEQARLPRRSAGGLSLLCVVLCPSVPVSL